MSVVAQPTFYELKFCVEIGQSVEVVKSSNFEMDAAKSSNSDEIKASALAIGGSIAACLAAACFVILAVFSMIQNHR